MTITADDVVAAYIKTRDEIAARKKLLEEELRPLQELQEKRENWLIGEIVRTGLKNLPTKHGTAYITRAESVTVADWDAFFDYVQRGEKWELLEHRAAKVGVLEIMGEERQNPPPPGLNYSALQKIGVRKS